MRQAIGISQELPDCRYNSRGGDGRVSTMRGKQLELTAEVVSKALKLPNSGICAQARETSST